MKELYTKPAFDVESFATVDVITTSAENVTEATTVKPNIDMDSDLD